MHLVTGDNVMVVIVGCGSSSMLLRPTFDFAVSSQLLGKKVKHRLNTQRQVEAEPVVQRTCLQDDRPVPLCEEEAYFESKE